MGIEAAGASFKMKKPAAFQQAEPEAAQLRSLGRWNRPARADLNPRLLADRLFVYNALHRASSGKHKPGWRFVEETYHPGFCPRGVMVQNTTRIARTSHR